MTSCAGPMREHFALVRNPRHAKSVRLKEEIDRATTAM